MKKKILNKNIGTSKPGRYLRPGRFILGLSCLLCCLAHGQSLYNSGDTISITSGTTLYINGGMQNLLNGSLLPDVINKGAINLTGNLQNATGTLYSGNGLLQMSGTGSQTFSGANYYDLRVTGSGVKTMSGATHIKDSLVFSNGSISTSADTIFVDSVAGIKELPASEVIGNMKYQKYLQKGTPYTFGNLGLTLAAYNATPGITTVVRITGPTGIEHYGTAHGIERYFDITPAKDTGLNATITFYYEDAELNSVSESDIELFKSDTKGSTWTPEGYTSRNSTSNFITLSGLNSLSRWTAGSISSPLPVELLSFNAKLLNPRASLLDWETASELNSDHFDIERSEDGINFNKIGEEKAQGTTQDRHDYTYTDNFGITTANVLYYRLKEVDANGAYMYSEVRKVKLQPDAIEFRAWYNAETNKIEALLSNTKEINGALRMIDIQGKLIAEQKIHLPAGQARVQLDMLGLSQGIYTLYYSGENEVQVRRVMKH